MVCSLRTIASRCTWPGSATKGESVIPRQYNHVSIRRHQKRGRTDLLTLSLSDATRPPSVHRWLVLLAPHFEVVDECERFLHFVNELITLRQRPYSPEMFQG